MTEDEKAALANVYERAAELIETAGWRQSLNGMGVTHCVGTAMGTIAGQCSPLYLRAVDVFCSALELPRGVGAMVDWNDDPTRTVDEVINTLHALANKLR